MRGHYTHLGCNECWLLGNRWLQDMHCIEVIVAPTMLAGTADRLRPLVVLSRCRMQPSSQEGKAGWSLLIMLRRLFSESLHWRLMQIVMSESHAARHAQCQVYGGLALYCELGISAKLKLSTPYQLQPILANSKKNTIRLYKRKLPIFFASHKDTLGTINSIQKRNHNISPKYGFQF